MPKQTSTQLKSELVSGQPLLASTMHDVVDSFAGAFQRVDKVGSDLVFRDLNNIAVYSIPLPSGGGGSDIVSATLVSGVLRFLDASTNVLFQVNLSSLLTALTGRVSDLEDEAIKGATLNGSALDFLDVSSNTLFSVDLSPLLTTLDLSGLEGDLEDLQTQVDDYNLPYELNIQGDTLELKDSSGAVISDVNIPTNDDIIERLNILEIDVFRPEQHSSTSLEWEYAGVHPNISVVNGNTPNFVLTDITGGTYSNYNTGGVVSGVLVPLRTKVIKVKAGDPYAMSITSVISSLLASTTVLSPPYTQVHPTLTLSFVYADGSGSYVLNTDNSSSGSLTDRNYTGVIPNDLLSYEGYFTFLINPVASYTFGVQGYEFFGTFDLPNRDNTGNPTGLEERVTDLEVDASVTYFSSPRTVGSSYTQYWYGGISASSAFIEAPRLTINEKGIVTSATQYGLYLSYNPPRSYYTSYATPASISTVPHGSNAYKMWQIVDNNKVEEMWWVMTSANGSVPSTGWAYTPAVIRTEIQGTKNGSFGITNLSTNGFSMVSQMSYGERILVVGIKGY